MSTSLSSSTTDGNAPLAQPFGVEQWVDASGQPLPAFDLAAMGSGYKLVFCFQHACPGCHLTGFPTLARLVEALRGENIRFAAVQTVFEDFGHNSVEAMREDQRRYALPIPFGHDAGEDGSGSVLMQRYGNGGTPWFLLIDPQGRILHSHFRIDADKTIALVRQAARAAPAAPLPAGVPDWNAVLRWARDGNPPPPRRVQKTEAEWREQLTPEQFHVTREKGTEPAHSSAMCTLFEPGRYACVCCGTALFDASAKYSSRSGWPSFTQPLAEGLVGYIADDSYGMRRVETVCQVCDAHLGHVFPDGPEPSGLRYCINALSLQR